MNKLVWSVCVAFVAVFSAACHEDDGSEADGQPRKDGSGYEALIVPEGGAADAGIDQGPSWKCDPATLGKYCQAKLCDSGKDCPLGEQCGENGHCSATKVCGAVNNCLTMYEDDEWGVCSCRCTVDDANTPLPVEDTCPDLGKNECVKTGTTQAYCLRRCDPALGKNPCDGELACVPGSAVPFGIWSQTYCLEKGCKVDSDCMVWTSTVCDTKQKNCGTGESCLPSALRGGCSKDEDCEEGYYCLDYEGISLCTTKDGSCGKPGKCDTASGLCDKKPLALSKETAQVGDPCKDDTECGQTMHCLIEFDQAKYKKTEGSSCRDDSECCSDICNGGKCGAGSLCAVQYRNGYCTVRGCAHAKTLSIAKCPAGSTCNRSYGEGGLCQKSCDLTKAESCRAYSGDKYGDYECRDWSTFELGGYTIAAVPTCDFGPQVTCSLFEDYDDISCSDLGLVGNSTNMTCRTIDGTATTDAKDPHGYCLDDTASGPKSSTP